MRISDGYARPNAMREGVTLNRASLTHHSDPRGRACASRPLPPSLSCRVLHRELPLSTCSRGAAHQHSLGNTSCCSFEPSLLQMSQVRRQGGEMRALSRPAYCAVPESQARGPHCAPPGEEALNPSNPTRAIWPNRCIGHMLIPSFAYVRQQSCWCS